MVTESLRGEAFLQVRWALSVLGSMYLTRAEFQKLHELLRLTFRSLYVARKISSTEPELILGPGIMVRWVSYGI